MKSATVMTREIDDLQSATDELVAGVKNKLAFGKAAAGIVYCDADADVAELGRLLREKLGCDIMGLTTTAFIHGGEGYCDMGIVLTVLTGDDVGFAIAATGDLTRDNDKEAVRAAYAAARASLTEDPELILICAPYIATMTPDGYMEELDKVSGNTPVFGGVATDHYDLKHQKTFFNGQAYDGALVLLLVAGNVRPVFAMEHRFGGRLERKGVITQSTDNNVERIGDQTFKEFLSDITPVPDDEVVIYQFQSTPFVMELPDYEADEQPVVRALCTIDHARGSGGFLSRMPVGSRLSINVLQRDNLADSCAVTLERALNMMEENAGYEYSLMLISTCNARHLLMADTKDMESEILREKLAALKPGLNVMGFYGFGEMCPTSYKGKGKAKNRFHNVSFAVCAL